MQFTSGNDMLWQSRRKLTQKMLFPWGDLGCQGSPRAKREDGSSNGKFGRVAAGPVCAVEETLAELVSVLFGGLKKADGSWEDQMHRTS